MIQTFKNKNFFDIFFIVLIVLFFIYLFFNLNIINSGYHIIDDHEILYFPSIINKDTFFDILSNFIKTDGRFRPVYWIHRISLFYFFKANFFLYYFEFFILGILSSLCLFFTFKSISKSRLCSLILLCFLFFGHSLSIFTRLGYGELLSLTLLSCSLFFMTLKNDKYKFLNQSLSLFFLILCMLSKEQFLIAVPFILLFKILYDSKSKNVSFISALKNNFIYILISSILFLIVLGFAYAFMGKDFSSHYVISLKISYLLDSLYYVLNIDYIKQYVYEYILFVFISISGLFFIKSDKKTEYITYIFIIFIFVLSQLIFINLTPNNGFQFRYLFPAVLSPVIMLAVFLKEFREKNYILYYFLLISIIVCAFFNLKYYSFSYVKQENDNNIVFNNYLEKTKSILNKEDNILLIGSAVNTMEFFESLARYYNHYGYKNVYIFANANKSYDLLSDFEKNLYNYLSLRFENMRLKDMKKDAKLIISFEYTDENKKYNEKSSMIDFQNLYQKINDKYMITDFYVRKN